jgi:hypothetical protein
VKSRPIHPHKDLRDLAGLDLKGTADPADLADPVQRDHPQGTTTTMDLPTVALHHQTVITATTTAIAQTTTTTMVIVQTRTNTVETVEATRRFVQDVART